MKIDAIIMNQWRPLTSRIRPPWRRLYPLRSIQASSLSLLVPPMQSRPR